MWSVMCTAADCNVVISCHQLLAESLARLLRVYLITLYLEGSEMSVSRYVHASIHKKFFGFQ